MKYITSAHAYIDGANLHKGVESLGWQLDYKRFRVWLSDKYNISNAYIFLRYIEHKKSLYNHLRECGYHLVFKETTIDSNGQIKGNCDADLVVYAMRQIYEQNTDNAVLVTSDGDYASLVRFMLEKKCMRSIVSTSDNCSVLLKRTNAPILYLSSQKAILIKK